MNEWKVFEKSWFTSKKFWAFLIMEALLFTLALMALKLQPNLGWPLSAFMVFTVFVMGFCAVEYVGKQADLDKFIRGAAIEMMKESTPVQVDEEESAEVPKNPVAPIVVTTGVPVVQDGQTNSVSQGATTDAR